MTVEKSLGCVEGGIGCAERGEGIGMGKGWGKGFRYIRGWASSLSMRPHLPMVVTSL